MPPVNPCPFVPGTGGVGSPRIPGWRRCRSISTVLHRDEGGSRRQAALPGHHAEGRPTSSTVLARARVLTGIPGLAPAAPPRPAHRRGAAVHDRAAVARCRLPGPVRRRPLRAQGVPGRCSGSTRSRAFPRGAPGWSNSTGAPGLRGRHEPNAETLGSSLHRARRALYRLDATHRPHPPAAVSAERTRHSDRGRPPLYPREIDVAPDDFTCPLQLLATLLEFDDPVDGTRRRFDRPQAAWPT